MSASAPPPPPPRERGPRPGRLVFGGVILILGVLWLLESLDVQIPGRIVGSSALIVVGVGLVVASRWGQSQGGLIALGLILTLVLALATLVPLPISSEVGDRVYRPATPEQVRDRYELSVGSLTLDLTALGTAEFASRGGSPTIRARVGIGQLTVIVPQGDFEVVVRARAGLGQIVVFGVKQGGAGVDYRTSRIPAPAGITAWSLDATVGIGQVEVRHG